MSETEARIGILVADGHSLFREAMRAALEGQPDLRVVGEARDGVEALAEARRRDPDVALLNADLSNGDGIETTRLIRDQVPDCRVIVLSGEEDEDVLLEAVEAGAHGYLTKAVPLSDVMEASRAVHRGETVISPRLLGTLLPRLTHRRREQDEAMRRVARLTMREREVLTLLAAGGDNDSIAEALVISPQTVRTHIQNVLVKLEVHSRLEAAALAIQHGLLGAGAR